MNGTAKLPSCPKLRQHPQHLSSQSSTSKSDPLGLREASHLSAGPPRWDTVNMGVQWLGLPFHCKEILDKGGPGRGSVSEAKASRAG